jgi:AcrR family transcriptional regulator
LLAQLAREAVLSVILADGHEARIPVATQPKVSAIALREALRAQPRPEMSPGQAMLIDEWLQRLAECDSGFDVGPPRMTIANESPMSSTAQRILQAAADLLRSGGPQAVSTRLVAAAAGVQPPDLYRLFGDKDRLVDQAVAEVQRDYLHCKRRTLRATDDPMMDFRRLWQTHVEFGLANPEVYVLGYARTRSEISSLARSEMSTLFQQRLAALGRHGRLGLSVDRATAVAVLLGVGATTMQIPLAKRKRDHRLTQMSCLSAEAAFTVENSVPAASTAKHAEILRHALKGTRDVPLSGAERGLLNEWLLRLARPTE